MYSPLQLAGKYIQHYIRSDNGKGHGVHSPFVYDFIRKVLLDKKTYLCYKEIELMRNQLLADTSMIDVEDFGAGSAVIKTNRRQVSKIAASSLKSKKYSRLLFRIVQYYQRKNIIELGTSFGITTAYLSSGNKHAQIHTLEGASKIAEIAERNFKALALDNIQLVKGDFAVTLPKLLGSSTNIDLAFIDGNHRKEPTLHYFSALLQHVTADTVIVMDDIHWSKGMEEAWDFIKADKRVTLTIDLFFVGLVYINPDFKVKQHFKIRF